MNQPVVYALDGIPRDIAEWIGIMRLQIDQDNITDAMFGRFVVGSHAYPLRGITWRGSVQGFKTMYLRRNKSRHLRFIIHDF